MAQGKRFLTKRGDEGGSVRWHIGEGESILSSGDSGYLSAELIITDCYKAVSLDFDCYKYSDHAKRITKLRALIAELTAFELALGAAQQAAKPKRLYY